MIRIYRIIKDPIVAISVCFSLIALIVSIFIAVVGLNQINGEIILNISSRSLPVLGHSLDIFSILWILPAILTINTILIFETYNREKFISYIFSSANIVISAIILVAVYMVVSLN